MELCRTSNTDYQKNLIIEENLSTGYIKKIPKRKEYVDKFREYKAAYKAKWHKAKLNDNEQIYLDDTRKFIYDMKPYNKLLKDNKISKEDYLKILNKRKDETIY